MIVDTLYYISVFLASAIMVFFAYAIDYRILFVIVPTCIYLFVFPNARKKESIKTATAKSKENNVTEDLEKDNISVEVKESKTPEHKSSNKEEASSQNIREEYIYMGVRAYTKHGISLSSQKFDTKEEAEYFADVFRNNYTSRVRVLELVGGGYGVFADFVPERQIKSNYRRENDGYIFANWKFEHRRNLPSPPPEHFMDKHPKVSDVLICGVITWPVFAVILFFEWLRGAAWIPNDNMVKVSSQELANMNGAEFETYVGRRLKAMGYKNVRVTQASGDFGADVIAVNSNGETVCIQCKHYSQPVGIKAVQEIYSAKQYYNCQKAMVITNSTYTQAAIDLAKSTGVDLWANFR